MKLPRISGWFWVAWIGAFGVLEGIALLNGTNNGDTLTEMTIAQVPGWIIYMGIGWLIWHFRRAK